MPRKLSFSITSLSSTPSDLKALSTYSLDGDCTETQRLDQLLKLKLPPFIPRCDVISTGVFKVLDDASDALVSAILDGQAPES